MSLSHTVSIYNSEHSCNVVHSSDPLTLSCVMYHLRFCFARIKKHLGSGQFGTVNKGVWQCPRGEREVAIKLLQAGAMEDSRVKFLKEAAIMGQFSHRNIISLFGVVTLGDPVSRKLHLCHQFLFPF